MTGAGITRDLEAHGLRRPRLRRAIPDAPQDVPALLAAATLACPDREAIASSTRRLTFRELQHMSFRAARAWAAVGVGPGDRVACSLPNEIDIVVDFFGAMHLGAIWVAISKSLAPSEVRLMLDDSDASVFLTSDTMGRRLGEGGFPPAIRVLTVEPGGTGDWPQLLARCGDGPFDSVVDPFAPAAISYTSGTTGFPKGAVHSQHNMVLVAVGQRTLGRLQPRSRQGVVLPLSLLNMQLVGPLAAFLVQSTLIVLERTQAVPLAQRIAAESVQSFVGVPTIIHDLLTNDEVASEQLTTLERVWVGGAEPSEEFRRLFAARFGVEPANGYGLTESPNGCITERPGEPHLAGCVGRAYPTLQALVVDLDGRRLPAGEQGELCIAACADGPYAEVYTPMLGYWKRPEETASVLVDDVLHTGDIAIIDASGNVFLNGRRNGLILRGGANVYPAEVERVMASYPGVRGVAVLGIEDERLGERVVAIVEAADPTTIDAKGLRDHCHAELSRYKVPSDVRVIESLPRNAMGKVVLRDLRALFDEGAPPGQGDHDAR